MKAFLSLRNNQARNRLVATTDHIRSLRIAIVFFGCGDCRVVVAQRRFAGNTPTLYPPRLNARPW